MISQIPNLRFFKALRKLYFAEGYGMSNYRVMNQYGGIIFDTSPELYFHLNNKVGEPEGAD